VPSVREGCGLEALWVRLAYLERMLQQLAEAVVCLRHEFESGRVGNLVELSSHVELLLLNQIKFAKLLERSLIRVGGRDLMRGSVAGAPGLNSTEVEVLRMLAEKPMTAPEIGRRLGKSREHVARTMNKLYRGGYVDRNVQSIPYVYTSVVMSRHVVLEEFPASTPTP